MFRTHSAALLSTLLVAAFLPAQKDDLKDLQRQADRLRDQVVKEREALLEDVTVNEVKLDPKVVKREAVYLTGGKLVEAKVADFFIIEEMQKQIAAGKDPSTFVVTDDDVMKDLDTMKADFEMKNPGVDFWDVVRSQYGLSRETFIQQRKQSVLFDKVFFPGNPRDWPSITKEAIKANTSSQGGENQGQQFLDQLEKATEGVDEHGAPKKLPEFWVQMLRQFVQKGLRNWSDIKYASNGLPPESVLFVNGRTWSTDEAFDYVKQGLYVQDLERALNEVVVREALRQELIKNKVYVSDEEFQKRYEEYRKPYDDTPFTVEVIATRFKGYPCLEAFRARWRLITSYQDLIKDELDNDHLQAHADKFAAFFADGQTSIDLIPFQGRDQKSGSWLPGGMDAAKKRCEAVFAELEKGKMTFDEALDKKGEFFATDENKGRLGFKPLNQVRQQLRESEFTQLHDGLSMTNYLFYDAEVGKTVGPLPGPDAWYIARVDARTPASRKLDMKNDRERELVREDYINYRFLEWAKGVLSKTKVK